ncbi:polysaccharide biosynthesis protein [Palaeococcus pacificus DY20341]|uniref:Polysaccharide biosynthesis protein n=1 Tax=Palaeococcus pacificus DY20341 TaxID=1343739 RepID=A0A075LUE7_9EURY|nr:flippase [Palaeococcus pacificus]AIF70345.1 polysaccharide biosynthesis protein [Palaeococcus pacificus DY20341]
MSEASQALQRIAKGTGIVFFGTVFWLFFEFLSRAIIARHYSTSEYGVFNLALTVLSIALVIATLGFQNSLPREVAFYREKEPSRVRDLISTALIIVAVNSIIWVIVLILGAEDIAQIFNETRLAYALKIVAFALPFSALIGTIIPISQGFGRVREKVYFQNVVYPTLFLIFVIAGALLNLPFAYVFFAYIAAQAFTLLALIFDVLKVKLFEFKTSLDLKLGRGLIVFSLPLLFTGLLGFVMTWADTLMLGYYKSSEVVGLYNAASPLAKLLPIFLGSASFLYVPIASRLYAQEKIGEMGRVYQILTKWVFLLTLPLFAVMFLFPEATIGFFFGAKYTSAAPALRILALGFMFHTFLGLNGWSLIIVKESKFISFSTFIAAVFNIILNALLIPPYGMKGAAVATAVSYFISNVLNSFRLYRRTKIHPFSWNYVKPLVISFVLLGLIQSLHLRVPSIWYAILILAVFLLIYFFLVLLSKSIDKEDIELFLAIEKKLGVDSGIIKRVLRRFV